MKSNNLWHQMADFNWIGIATPEKYSGLNDNFLDLCIFIEAMGSVTYETTALFIKAVLTNLTVILRGSGQDNEIVKEIKDKVQVANYAALIGYLQHTFNEMMEDRSKRNLCNETAGCFEAIWAWHHYDNLRISIDQARSSIYKAALQISKGKKAELSAARSQIIETLHRMEVVGAGMEIPF